MFFFFFFFVAFLKANMERKRWTKREEEAFHGVSSFCGMRVIVSWASGGTRSASF